MIPCRCTHCGKDLKVKDHLAGKRIKCPDCQEALKVPQAASTPQSLSPGIGEKGLEEERTLPPRGCQDVEQGTLPPIDLGPTESLEPTDAGLREERAQDMPGEGAEFTDFLAPAQAADELGRLGGFRILKVLGHGGMGVVFQGEDPKLGRKVAIKAMLPHLAQSRSSRERFLREARAAATLEHDHIVPILQIGEDRGVPFIVMPFLQGEPLDKRIHREKILPLSEVLRIGRETAKGLAAAHQRGLIHRDIKPANLWLEGEEGRVKILDFGLARAVGDLAGLTQSGAIVGTPQYMSPEQAGGKKNIDHRCDLFSLGCVLYRLATGQLPFKGDDTLAVLSALAMDQPPEPGKVNRQIPQALSNLIMNLLAKKPEDRPASAAEVAEALAELAARNASPTPTPKAGKTTVLFRPRSLGPRRKWVLAAAGLLLLAGVGGIVLFLGSKKTDTNRQAENKDQGSTKAPLPVPEARAGRKDKEPASNDIQFQMAKSFNAQSSSNEQGPKAMVSSPEKVVAELQSGDQGRTLGQLISLQVASPTKPNPEIARATAALLFPAHNILLRQSAARALIHWATPESVPALIKTLDDEDIIVRNNVMDALARLKAASAAPALARKLSTLDRIKAGRVLRALGPAAEAAVLEHAKDKDELARMEVCDILKDIGTARSVKTLTAMQQDEGALVRLKAGEALKAIAKRK